jgi:hypothetical protein
VWPAPWSASPEWKGEAVFIIAGGPSVAQQDLGPLRGRRTIAINSSWEAAPLASVLFFGDERWWRHNRERLAGFGGRIVTVAKFVAEPGLLRMEKRRPPPALASERTALAMRYTSLAGAINLAVHLGAARLVLLGADLKAAANGRTHHHKDHPWPAKPGCWDKQLVEVRAMAGPLAALGIEVVNTSMESRIDWWAKRPLVDCLH